MLENRQRGMGGAFCCKNEPTLEHRIQKGDAPVLRRLQLSQGKGLVQPLQFRRTLHELRIDQLPCRRETPVG